MSAHFRHNASAYKCNPCVIVTLQRQIRYGRMPHMCIRCNTGLNPSHVPMLNYLSAVALTSAAPGRPSGGWAGGGPPLSDGGSGGGPPLSGGGPPLRAAVGWAAWGGPVGYTYRVRICIMIEYHQ